MHSDSDACLILFDGRRSWSNGSPTFQSTPEGGEGGESWTRIAISGGDWMRTRIVLHCVVEKWTRIAVQTYSPF
jgi:hypothetical protein